MHIFDKQCEILKKLACYGASKFTQFSTVNWVIKKTSVFPETISYHGQTVHFRTHSVIHNRKARPTKRAPFYAAFPKEGA